MYTECPSQITVISAAYMRQKNSGHFTHLDKEGNPCSHVVTAYIMQINKPRTNYS